MVGWEDRPLETALDRLVSGAPDLGPTAAVLAVATPTHSHVMAHGWQQTMADGERLADPPDVQPSTLFDIGSVTKVVTTALLLRLSAAGEIDLSSSVRHWRPRFAGTPEGDLSLHQLATHRGGLWEWWPLYLRARQPDEALSFVDALPLRYRPDDARHYSDLGFMLLGNVIEQVSGNGPAGLAEIADALLFRPLGMTATGYAGEWMSDWPSGVAATSRGDAHERTMIARGHPYPVTESVDAFGFARTHTLRGEANDGNAFHAFGGVAGHAGLFSTASDLCRLGLALALPERAGLWDDEHVRRFTADWRDAGQALGFRTRSHRGRRLVEHPGFPGAFWAVDIDAARSVTLLTNRLHPSSYPVPLDDAWQEILTAALDDTQQGDSRCACSA